MTKVGMLGYPRLYSGEELPNYWNCQRFSLKWGFVERGSLALRQLEALFFCRYTVHTCRFTVAVACVVNNHCAHCDYHTILFPIVMQHLTVWFPLVWLLGSDLYIHMCTTHEWTCVISPWDVITGSHCELMLISACVQVKVLM